MEPRANINESQWDELLDTAHAWQFVPSAASPNFLSGPYLSWLSAEERAQCALFRTERLRHEYMRAHALCRATLSQYAPCEPSVWRFGKTRLGKPKIIAPAEFQSLRFSLTHTAGLIICLVSRAGDVGVDAEETSRMVDVMQVSRHFLPASVQAVLADLPASEQTARFFEQWVLKEAYLKAIGRGLGEAPERSAVRANEFPARIGNWQFYLHRPTTNHVAAAAIRAKRDAGPVSVRWMTICPE